VEVVASKSSTPAAFNLNEEPNNSFQIMVGAGRFERPTPCAQGMGRPDLTLRINPVLSISLAEINYTSKSGL